MLAQDGISICKRPNFALLKQDAMKYREETWFATLQGMSDHTQSLQKVKQSTSYDRNVLGLLRSMVCIEEDDMKCSEDEMAAFQQRRALGFLLAGFDEFDDDEDHFGGFFSIYESLLLGRLLGRSFRQLQLSEKVTIEIQAGKETVCFPQQPNWTSHKGEFNYFERMHKRRCPLALII
jgi:hypothetical protein